MQKLAYRIGNRLFGKSEYVLITCKLTEFILRHEAKYSAVVQCLISTSYNLKRLHFVCFVSSPIPSLLPMVQRKPPQAVWFYHCAPWFQMLRGVQESKNIDYARQHHIPHCWLPAKVLYTANSTKRLFG